MNGSIATRPSADAATADDVVERILAEYEPMVRRARRAMAGVWQDRRVSKSGLVILFQLQLHGDLPMSRLASLLDVSLPSLTGIVSRMEEHGLVERVRDGRDRRIVLVRATEQGHEAVREVEAVRRDQMRRIVEALGPADRVLVLRAFEALRGAAERLDAEPSPPAIP